MPALGISDVCGSLAMKTKLILSFMFNHFTRFYEKLLEDEAIRHKTRKGLVGLSPALQGVPWPVIQRENRRYAGKEAFSGDSPASWKGRKAAKEGV